MHDTEVSDGKTREQGLSDTLKADSAVRKKKRKRRETFDS